MLPCPINFRSVYELPDDPSALLKLVYDSADTVERGTCKHFPWSHNAVAGEDMSPTNNMGNNTLYTKALLEEDDELIEELQELNDPNEGGCSNQGDGTSGACPLSKTVDWESGKVGPSVENVAVGEACGRLVAVAGTEASAIALLYDITNIQSPDLLKVFHLSPSSKDKSPGVAYNDGTIGEIITRDIIFLSSNESPSGKPGVIFVGEQSGTLSFWEFECQNNDDSDDGDHGVGSASSSSSANITSAGDSRALFTTSWNAMLKAFAVAISMTMLWTMN